MDHRIWFKDAHYGMMAHWGLYSLLAGEYRGRRVKNYAEWIQSFMAIPNGEYARLAECFNPVCFDADRWVRLAKDAGMRYFVFTAKHHDGFAMFRSKADGFNVADATPFQRDVVEELANACARHGLKFGLYYSQELDWAHPHGGGYTRTDPCAGVSWDNSWDFPDRSKKDFTRCFEEKIKPQVEELLRNYGELCLMWFDVPHTITPEQSQQLYDLVKRYQPNCLLNSRLGNGVYDYVSLGDNEYPTEAPPAQLAADPNSVDGYKYSPYGLYETPATMNRSWGFCYHDHAWLTPEAIRDKREALNKLGINYLLNVGPDGLGRIPSFCEEALLSAAPGKK